MKKIYLLSIIIFTVSCNQKSKIDQNETPVVESKTKIEENLDWLNGDWKRLNDKDGKETFESWKKINSSEYSGIGFTMKKKDTVSQEQMSLIKSNGEWSLFVKTPNEKKPIKFKMTELNEDKFVCINDSIDFPKRIQYWIENGKLKAKISNEKMEIPFEFKKVK
ncbi:hypothetical protein FF18_08900 [Elizabethkingia anophelis]|uniref:DUF6265 family protein n=1 Tax=Elizabethkingia anophelis TaxID=1117645 RepID=UPI0004E32BAB|nr:DUF6265 family protein [Elizabethkingia anophelis]KFC33507.1 hypothetical protein FF18_08900 [Elizabethkingia anophelis]